MIIFDKYDKIWYMIICEGFMWKLFYNWIYDFSNVMKETKSMKNSNKHGRMTFLKTFHSSSGKSQIMNLWLASDSIILMKTGG